jgi:hypothetical protein
MRFEWKKVAMIMLVGLLFVAGPAVPRYAVAQNAPGPDKMLNDAQAMQDKAIKAWNDTMMKMNSMKSMPMNANEKGMMNMMQQMMDTMKSIADANKATLDALKSYMESHK